MCNWDEGVFEDGSFICDAIFDRIPCSFLRRPKLWELQPPVPQAVDISQNWDMFQKGIFHEVHSFNDAEFDATKAQTDETEIMSDSSDDESEISEQSTAEITLGWSLNELENGP